MPSLLEALERKYFDDSAFENGNADGVDDDSSSSLVGTPPISIFIPRLPPLVCVPELLVLNDCDIDHAGNCEVIKEKCRRVRELDLAQNKLKDWPEILNILQHMPRIEFLNLSRNLLNGTPITRTLDPAPAAMSNMRNLVLNGTCLDWLCVDVLLANLPVLEELHLSLNEYDEVLIDTCCCCCAGDSDTANMETECCNANNCCADADDDDDDAAANTTAITSVATTTCCKPSRCRKIAPHRALKTLHFTGNPIENWLEICRLGRVFPSLEDLVLADCPIKSLEICDTSNTNSNSNSTVENIATVTPTNDDAPFRHFRNVKLLNLSCANINKWDDIDQLSKFPQLRNLRVKNLPLWERVESTEHERRQLLIARLPNVSLLNGGGRISDDEREDAERAFIRYYMEKPEWERPKRYDELLARHGKLEPLVNINLKPEKRVTVLITYKERTQQRLVNVYNTVADLKVKLEKVINLPANKMRFYYLDKDFREEGGPEEMRYPNKQLYTYNLQSGDEIFVDEKK